VDHRLGRFHDQPPQREPFRIGTALGEFSARRTCETDTRKQTGVNEMKKQTRNAIKWTSDSDGIGRRNFA